MKDCNIIKTVLILFLTLTVINSGNSKLQAQPGPTFSVSYDILPYQDFDKPIILEDSSSINNAQVKISTVRANFSYPIVFSESKTILVNEFSYQLIEFEYRNLSNPINRLHSGSYTLMLQQRVSEKWSLWVLATPSIASDLKAEVSKDDFNFQAAMISIRHFSERFSLGFGAAYSTQFGSKIPLPVIAFDWNNGENLIAKAILPVSLEFWYRSNSHLDVGIVVSGDGNNFHGDPEIYKVTNPELRYTMLTIGPAAKLKVSNKLVLNFETGLIGLHRFEFYDNDNEINSYDLKPRQYVRIGFSFGE